jgi:hypothetical protein
MNDFFQSPNDECCIGSNPAARFMLRWHCIHVVTAGGDRRRELGIHAQTSQTGTADHRMSTSAYPMNWRERITAVYEGRRQQPGLAGKPEFYPAASAQEISDTEVELNAKLPGSFRSLLLETNGVMDMLAIDGGDWFKSMWLFWNIDEIVKQNRYSRAATEKRTFERDFTTLVFFAGAGTDGILFAFPVEDGFCSPRVMVWHPIMNELEEIAPSLEDFLRGWLTNTISV